MAHPEARFCALGHTKKGGEFQADGRIYLMVSTNYVDGEIGELYEKKRPKNCQYSNGVRWIGFHGWWHEACNTSCRIIMNS